jgi:hypothetical protein
LEQLIFGQQSPAIANQNQEHLERLSMQRHRLTAPHELALVRLQLKVVEFVN